MSELPIWYCSIHTQFAWLHRINNNYNNNFHCLFLFDIFTIREAIDCLVGWFCTNSTTLLALITSTGQQVSLTVCKFKSLCCVTASQSVIQPTSLSVSQPVKDSVDQLSVSHRASKRFSCSVVSHSASQQETMFHNCSFNLSVNQTLSQYRYQRFSI